MKLKLLLLALGFSLFSASSYANTSTTPVVSTISDVKKMPDKSSVNIAGKVIKMIGNDDFIIQDATGTIEIEIDLYSKEDKIKFFADRPNLIGATILVNGILDNEFLETTKVDVKVIRVDSEPSADAFVMATEGDNSKIQSIKTAKSLKNKDYVILSGTVTQITGNDDFILQDVTGSIKIDMEFRSKGEEIKFTSETLPTLLNSNIVIEGFLDKEIGDKTKIDASRFKVLNGTANRSSPLDGIPNQAGR